MIATGNDRNRKGARCRKSLLAGKVALVTGADGVGAGLCRTVGGARVRRGNPRPARARSVRVRRAGTTLSDTARAVGETHGVKTVRVLGDLSKADQVASVVQETIRALGLSTSSCTAPGGHRGGGGQTQSERRGHDQGSRCSQCARPQPLVDDLHVSGSGPRHDGTQDGADRDDQFHLGVQGLGEFVDLRHVQSGRRRVHALSGGAVASVQRDGEQPRPRRHPHGAFSGERGRWTRRGWSRTARSTALVWWTKSRESWSFLPARSGSSSPVKCCGWTAAARSGPVGGGGGRGSGPCPITTDDEVHHPVRRKPFHHKGHEAKTPRASWKHPASSHCGKPSLRGITHVRRRGPRRFVGEIDSIPAFLCALRTYPKTRLRLFSNPSMLGCRAGVRGFADKLLEPIRKPGCVVQQPVDARVPRGRQRVFG